MDNTPVSVLCRSAVLVILTAVVCVNAAAAGAQAPVSLETFRIFLRDGRMLSSYGEFARVEDDLVIVVTQGMKGGVETHDLITVPVSSVDMDRTIEYANALRAAQYGATRGEREYWGLIEDVARAMAELEASDDKDRRLGIAQVARRRLVSWSSDHFGYRAADLRQLVSIVDEVIVELQAAAGLSHFSLDLVANAPPASRVLLQAAPTPEESVKMALAAASIAPIGVEKLALLRSANRVVETLPGAPAALRARVARALQDETDVENSYRALIRRAVTRADTAVRRGRPRDVTRLIAEVEAEDARLGRRRPRDVAAAIRLLQSEAELAAVQEAAFDSWNRVKARLRDYDRRVRAALGKWRSQTAVLEAIRDQQRVTPAQLDAAARRFRELDRALTALHPPDELGDVHGLFRSAVQMAQQGIVVGQRLAVAANSDLARNASAAVAGAELLRAQGEADLQAGLGPRTVR